MYSFPYVLIPRMVDLGGVSVTDMRYAAHLSSARILYLSNALG
jgi:hypothetical protein